MFEQQMDEQIPNLTAASEILADLGSCFQSCVADEEIQVKKSFATEEAFNSSVTFTNRASDDKRINSIEVPWQ